MNDEEVRGATIVAYTRISDEPILERGTIEHPDLIVVADETLMRDPAAGVLAGQESTSAFFIKTEAPGPLVKSHGIQPHVFGFDLTGRTLQLLGRASALCAGLGAAAARLVGVVSQEQMLETLHEQQGNHSGAERRKAPAGINLISNERGSAAHNSVGDFQVSHLSLFIRSRTPRKKGSHAEVQNPVHVAPGRLDQGSVLALGLIWP